MPYLLYNCYPPPEFLYILFDLPWLTVTINQRFSSIWCTNPKLPFSLMQNVSIWSYWYFFFLFHYLHLSLPLLTFAWSSPVTTSVLDSSSHSRWITNRFYQVYLLLLAPSYLPSFSSILEHPLSASLQQVISQFHLCLDTIQRCSHILKK